MQNAPRKTYPGPGQNLEFWFNQPEAKKLGQPIGMYHCTGGNGQVTLLAEDPTENMQAYWNGAVIADRFHCLSGNLQFARYGLITARDFVYDISNNWSLIKRNNMDTTPFVYSLEVAADPITNLVYGAFVDDNLLQFTIAAVDYNTRTIQRFGHAQHYYVAIGLSSQHRLYGIDEYGILYEISLEDGTDTKIGETGIVVNDPTDNTFFFQSGDIDQVDDVFYWAAVLPDGTSALYAVDLETAEATKVHDFPKYTLAKCFCIPDHTANNGAPAAVTGLKGEFDKTATSGEVVFTLPTLTFEGNELTGSLDYVIRIDGLQKATGNGEAGAEQRIPLTLTEGLHRIDVYAINSNGKGVNAKTSVFVGQDKPGQVDDATLNISGLSATISWEAATGQYEGYPGELTYNVVRYPDNVVVATGLSGLTVTDEIPTTDVCMYTYGIVATNGIHNGPEAKTNSVAAGLPYQVPYYDDFFSLKYVQDNYTVIDGNEDGIVWRPIINATNSTIVYGYMNSNQDWTNLSPDEWLMLPGIELNQGKEYTFTMKAKCVSSTTSHTVDINIGSTPSIEGQTVQLMEPTLLKTGIAKNYTANFSVEADGVYHISIHDGGDAIRMGNLIVDMVSVEETKQNEAPAAVTNATLVGGPNGAMEGILNFTAPTKTIGGNELPSLNSIKVMRNNKVVHVFENPAPGEELTCVDNTLVKEDQGFNYYQIWATNESGDGTIYQVKGYIGIDIPVFDYTTIRILDEDDKVKVRWDAVSEVGKNKGYVDVENVWYDVVDLIVDPSTNGMAYGDIISSKKNETEVSIPYATGEGDQKAVAYAIGAWNESGESNVGATYAMVVGQPYGLPFTQSATNQRLGGRLMWVQNENPSYAYEYSSDSYDDDNGSFRWRHQNTSKVWTMLNTGKITLAGSKNPKLLFAHKAMPGSPFQIVPIVFRRNDMVGDTLKVINYRDVEGDGATWTLEKFDLREYLDENYIIVKFLMKNDAKKSAEVRNQDLLIDAINVIDLEMFNLSIDIDAPERITAGKGKDVNVIVHNMGEEPIGNYRVKLYVNDELELEEDVAEELGSLERRVVTLHYTPDVFTGEGRATLRAEVECAYDLYDDDNMMEAEVEIVNPGVRGPENLEAVYADGGYDLSWSEPQGEAEEVAEGFESDEYTDFSLGGITEDVKEGMMGDWKIANYDDDVSVNNALGVLFDNARKPTAWMVFNTNKGEGRMPLKAHGGEKFAATFNGVNVQDTWLISPELSGEAQTVSFFANIPEPDKDNSGAPYEEWFEVMYNTVDADTANFVSALEVVRNTSEWIEYKVKLPYGAKHFAIHDVSQPLSAFGLFIDDVCFVRKAVKPVSYNLYADGVLLQTVSGELKFRVDGKAEEYSVTAVYGNGFESLPVVFFMADPTGIEEEGIWMKDEGLRGDIYSVDGKLVRKRATNTKGLPKGVYIINGSRVIIL